MFSANTVVYNVNGGDPYDSDNPETGHEIYIKRGSSYTNKTAATKRNDDGWRFTNWKYDDIHILGVNHKITYGSKTNDLSISQNDQTVVSGIPAEKGITLTAQWTYRQAFATTPEEDAEYTSFLNEDPNGVMAYINIPRLKSTLPIYHYTTPGIAAERRRPSTWLRPARRRQKHARRALRTPRPADLTPVHRP